MFEVQQITRIDEPIELPFGLRGRTSRIWLLQDRCCFGRRISPVAGRLFRENDYRSRGIPPRCNHCQLKSTSSCKARQDGKRLIGKNGEPWLVENSAALGGHEGQQVKVKCQLSSVGHEIHVLSLKTVATQTKYAVNLGDAAFRR